MVDNSAFESDKNYNLPKNWTISSLEALGRFSKGKGIAKSLAQSGDIPCVRYGELYTDHHNVVRHYKSFISPDVARESARIEFGDQLFAGSGEKKEEIGKSAAFIDTFEAYAGGDIVIFSPKEIDPVFLGYALNSELVGVQKEKAAQGDSVVHIYSSSLRKIELTYPISKQEQQAIADALSDADALIASLEKLIEKQQRLYQATMSELFVSGAETESKKNNWSLKTVEHFGAVVTGGTPPTSDKSYWGGFVPWITPSDISENTHVSFGERNITEQGLSGIRGVPANSLLVTCIASIGKNAITQVAGSCNQQINAIIPNANFDVNFLYFLFEYHKEAFRKSAGVTATPIISKEQLLRTEFFVPTLPIQRRIAEILLASQENILEHQVRLSKAKKVKAGMMQELLTGRARLI